MCPAIPYPDRRRISAFIADHRGFWIQSSPLIVEEHGYHRGGGV